MTPADVADQSKYRLPSKGDRAKFNHIILQVQQEAEVLVKNQHNQHSNYNYASIDQYYEKIVPIANRLGLMWHCDMLNVRSFGEKGDIMVDVLVHLELLDGTMWPAHSRFYILHAKIGAQTSGSSMSYADKVWMRQAFKIATGEGDADQYSGGGNPRPQWGNGRRADPTRADVYESNREDSRLGLRHTVTAPKYVEPRPGQNVAASSDVEPPGFWEAPPHDDEGPIARPKTSVDIAVEEQRKLREASRALSPNAKLERDVMNAAKVAGSTADLASRWRQWSSDLADLKRVDSAAYDRIEAAYKSRKEALFTQMTGGEVKPPQDSGRAPEATATAPAPEPERVSRFRRVPRDNDGQHA